MLRSCSEMAEICLREKETSTSTDSITRAARRKRMKSRRVKFVAGVSATAGNDNNGMKKRKVPISPTSVSRGSNDAVDNSSYSELRTKYDNKSDLVNECIPKFGVASVCGRRREMEDSVAIHPWFLDEDTRTSNMHYFGVYDGHGCSHVAKRCKERLHLLVKEELSKNVEESIDWKIGMERSFIRMDEEVVVWNQQATSNDCKCELHTPESYGVGSTAVVAVVTPEKIVVANCGDSRAVLCRNGKAIPLSIDHKPDRPDELNRIQAAGGRVLYWEGARVSGVLAMSRAIGDNYLKPYVTSEPEVTITDQTLDDEFLILASDGLWDVVSNETACGLASMCLKGNGPSEKMKSPPVNDASEYENSDMACSNASLLLTKLALARRSTDNVSVIVIDLRKVG